MSDKDASTPRVFLARHGPYAPYSGPSSSPKLYLKLRTGETEWTINGRYTGITELELTDNGQQQVLGTGRLLVGNGKLIDPARVTHIFVSPRKRAQKTFALLFDGADGTCAVDGSKVSVTEEIGEWGYGDYEGLLTEEIRAKRKEKGLDKERLWDIWRDGCEGGESAEEVTKRLDGLVVKIHDIQRDYMHGEKPVDVVVVAHGHILRAFAKRFLKYPMAEKIPMMLPPGAIGVLSYEEHNINSPGFLIGIALPPQK